MRRAWLAFGLVVLAAVVWAEGCTADGETSAFDDDSSPTGTGGHSDGTGGNGTGGVDFSTGGMTTTSGTGGIIVDPCDSECGPEELCDDPGTALDNDCDGLVDEGCPCNAGLSKACFKGDPSFLNDDGCFPGSMKCSELGQWGECIGGVHGNEMCADVSVGCHAIQSVPFLTVDLKPGTGNFSTDAISETFTVTCPAGVNPCPATMGSNYTPLQSGEYTVLYEKTTASGVDQCTYPLFVGAPGLRVELTWEWNYAALGGNDTVDLDLHLKKPASVTPWQGDSGNADDCAFSNCTSSDCVFGFCPTWFSGLMPPDPMKWYLDPVFENNTCYFAPKGEGTTWQSGGMGCHNPRLDSDNVFCDPTVTDPGSFDFCNPENINIDYMPLEQWTRIGVHYYSAHSQTYPVHPVVRIFCNGALAAELGSAGFYDPQAPVTFPASGGSSFGDDRTFWLVADVLFRDDECNKTCFVEPLYLDPVAKTPILTTVGIVKQSYGPQYPPIPPMMP